MEKKNSQTLNIDKKYLEDIQKFCELNKIEDLSVFVNQCFKQGFDIKKYGLLSDDENIKIVEKEIIKEVPVEVVKEVQVIKEVQLPPIEVEVIKYVDREVIKEIPVEKIVEKIVNISDKSGENELFGKIEQLENEMSKKDEELDILKKDLDILRHLNTEKPKNDKSQMLQETLSKVRAESLKKDEKIKELEEKINKINNQLGNTKAIYHQDSNLKNNL